MSHALVLTAANGVSDAVAAVATTHAETQGARIQAERRLGAAAYEIILDRSVTPRPIEALDQAVVALEGREKQLLIADMDSTMIPVECIDELADFAGVKDDVYRITEAAMQGELDFDGALRARVALLKGLPHAALEQCYAERITLNPGAEVLVRTMASRGAMTALVSGGFTFFTEKVAERAGFAMTRANTLLFEGDVLTGTVSDPILGRQAKRETMEQLCCDGGFGAEAVIAVGDGANDLAMVEAAGLGVAYRAKPALKEAAEAQLDHSDLTALLHLQGIPDIDHIAV